MRRLRARVSVARRRIWRLQGPIQPRRHAVRPVGLRRRRAVRSDREEAVLPRQSRRAGLQLWHAWLRSPLRLLSELGHVASLARSVSRLTPTDGDSRGPRCRCAGARRAGARLDLQRAADHRGVGRGDLQGSTRGRAQDGVRLERQRDTAGARLRASAPRLLQGRSQVVRRSPLSRARRPPRADPRLDPADSRIWGCGWRSSRC